MKSRIVILGQDVTRAPRRNRERSSACAGAVQAGQRGSAGPQGAELRQTSPHPHFSCYFLGRYRFFLSGHRVKSSVLESSSISNLPLAGGEQAADVPSSASAASTTRLAKAMSSMLPLTSRAEPAPSSRHRSTTCDGNTARQRPPAPGAGHCRGEGALLPETCPCPKTAARGFWGCLEPLSFKGSLRNDSFGERVTQGGVAFYRRRLCWSRVCAGRAGADISLQWNEGVCADGACAYGKMCT